METCDSVQRNCGQDSGSNPALALPAAPAWFSDHARPRVYSTICSCVFGLLIPQIGELKRILSTVEGKRRWATQLTLKSRSHWRVCGCALTGPWVNYLTFKLGTWPGWRRKYGASSRRKDTPGQQRAKGPAVSTESHWWEAERDQWTGVRFLTWPDRSPSLTRKAAHLECFYVLNWAWDLASLSQSKKYDSITYTLLAVKYYLNSEL